MLVKIRAMILGREAGAMKTILIVDDDPEMLAFMGLVLQRNGYIAKVARHGAEALQRLAEARTDLLITELRMPIMSGLEFLSQVRANGHDRLPAIVVTADDDPTQRRAAEALGVSDFLMKPFGLRQFNTVVQHALK
jgi:CheY-like chemotaxis protein